MGDYFAPPYVPIGPIKSFHAVPRFGHSSDITDIFTDDGSVDINKLMDYVMGSIFIAAFMLAAYILFVFMVAVLKVCFRKKAGILAGHPFVEDKSIFFDKPRKNAYFRGFLLMLTAAVISGGFIFLIKGTQKVRRVASDVRDGTKGFNIISQKVVETADMMIEFGDDSETLRDNLIVLIDQSLCEAYEGMDSVNPEYEFDKAAMELVNTLTEMQDFARDELTEIRNAFANDMMAISDQMNNTTDTAVFIANPAYYGAPTITLGFILFIGVILAWSEIGPPVYFCIQTWVFMPIFFILLFVSIVVITVVGAVLVANSDFCYGNPSRSPEGTVQRIYDVFSLGNNTRSALDYYIVDGCRGEYGQKIAVEDMIVQVNEGTGAAAELRSMIEQNQQQFETQCGGQAGSLNPLLGTLSLALDTFDDLVEIGDRTTDLLDCEGINSIWVDIVHGAVCTSAPDAFAWMFSSIMGVYVAGTMIYFLRGALLPSVDVKDIHNSHSDYDSSSEYYSDDELI